MICPVISSQCYHIVFVLNHVPQATGSMNFKNGLMGVSTLKSAPHVHGKTLLLCGLKKNECLILERTRRDNFWPIRDNEGQATHLQPGLMSYPSRLTCQFHLVMRLLSLEMIPFSIMFFMLSAAMLFPDGRWKRRLLPNSGGSTMVDQRIGD